MSKRSDTNWLRYITPKSNAGCLYWLFVYPFVFTFGLTYIFIKGLWALLSFITSPLRGKKLNVNLAGKALALPVIPLIITFCCFSLVGMAIIDSGLRSIGILPTYTPSPTATLPPSITPTALPPTSTSTPKPTFTPKYTATLETPSIIFTETVFAETSAPTPSPTTETPKQANVQIEYVNKKSEYVDIINYGSAAVDLKGWMLVSERGNQSCNLSGIIQPGQTLRIYAMSGPDGYSCGFSSEIWNNSQSDPAVLYNAEGIEVSRK